MARLVTGSVFILAELGRFPSEPDPYLTATHETDHRTYPVFYGFDNHRLHNNTSKLTENASGLNAHRRKTPNALVQYVLMQCNTGQSQSYTTEGCG